MAAAVTPKQKLDIETALSHTFSEYIRLDNKGVKGLTRNTTTKMIGRARPDNLDLETIFVRAKARLEAMPVIFLTPRCSSPVWMCSHSTSAFPGFHCRTM